MGKSQGGLVGKENDKVAGNSRVTLPDEQKVRSAANGQLGKVLR